MYNSKQEEKPKYPIKADVIPECNSWGASNLARLIHSNKHEVLGRTNRLLSFDAT
jgi:hypothetical protein